MTQSVLSIVADIDPTKLAGLRSVLDQMKPNPADNAVLGLGRFPTLHFAALVVAEGPGLNPPKLIFENNVDGTVEQWLQALVADGGSDHLLALPRLP